MIHAILRIESEFLEAKRDVSFLIGVDWVRCRHSELSTWWLVCACFNECIANYHTCGRSS